MNQEHSLTILNSLINRCGNSFKITFENGYGSIEGGGFSYYVHGQLTLEALVEAHAAIIAKIGTEEGWIKCSHNGEKK